MKSKLEATSILAGWLAGQRSLPRSGDLQLAGGETLHVEMVLRLLPGKRLVLRAHWQGRAVLAKLFVKDAWPGTDDVVSGN